MIMANREESNAAEHETFPGPGPLRADEAKRGIRPVEQMVDAAIDRIAREQDVARERRDSGIVDWGTGDRGGADGNTPVDRTPADRTVVDRSLVDRSRAERTEAAREQSDPGHALALAQQEEQAMALAAAGSLRRGKGRLRWKGLEVSDEFRRYADRVARGEDLPPFQGKILAEPDSAFPWNPVESGGSKRRAFKQQLGLWSGVAVFLGLSVWVLVVQVGKQADSAQRAAESPLALVVLSNEPSSAVPQPAQVPAAEPPVAAAAALEPAATPASHGAAPGTTALASLQEPTAATPAAAPSASRAARAPAVASSAAPAPAANPVGVFVATRPAADDLPATGVTAASPPAAAGALSGAGAASAHGLAGDGAAVATAGTVAPVAAGAAGPADAVASTAHADPKKEPGREASAMGPLLVETPSF
jgi:hypothetical protein